MEKKRSIDQLFKTDAKTESDEGLILDYGDFRVRIARAGGGNKRFGKVLSKKMKPYRRQVETDTMDEQVAARLIAETYADTVVLGMDVKNDKGGYDSGILRSSGVVEFSRDNVVAVFLEMPEFFKDVQAQANNVSLFRAIELEEDIKN